MTPCAVAALALGLAASAEDLWRREISNAVPLAGSLAGLALHVWSGGCAGLIDSAAGLATGFAVFLIFYAAGGMGGADVKLMAAFGALLGWKSILLAALLAAPAGALIAGAVLAFRRNARHIPYAPAITLGAWLALVGRG